MFTIPDVPDITILQDGKSIWGVKEFNETLNGENELVPTKSMSFVPLLNVPPVTKVSFKSNVDKSTVYVLASVLVNVISALLLSYVPLDVYVSVVITPLKLEPSPK